MSYNIDNVEIVSGSLRISQKNAKKAAKLDLPERIDLDSLKFGEDGYATFERFDFAGEGSGHAYPVTFRKLIALTEGDADLIMTWEGGESHGGGRVRGGKWKECEVIMALAPEEEGK